MITMLQCYMSIVVSFIILPLIPIIHAPHTRVLPDNISHMGHAFTRQCVRDLTDNSREISSRSLMCHPGAAYRSVKARINGSGRIPIAPVNGLRCHCMCAMAQSSLAQEFSIV